ncbi:hypothetical protein RF11_03920 [Thelohanellus kitauei]|uniref:Reverse transcriptase domain-containing protein n=1 Tax=Thelohanellus kitauei TaxID=669202 RepID=A0A0C2MBH7_THEKT|nr:hypothetical protein RF11_03920 [Thelohanellus kitauei]
MLPNTNSTFQLLSNKDISRIGLNNMIPYLYDIILLRKANEDHLRLIRNTFSVLKDASLAKNLSRFSSLGLVLSAEGVTTDPKTCDSIKNMGGKKNQELRRLLGFCGFYRYV